MVGSKRSWGGSSGAAGSREEGLATESGEGFSGGVACDQCEEKMTVIDKACRELNCDGGCGKVLGRRERRVSCSVCDFDLCMACAGGDEAKQVRDPGQDEVFGFNEHVYAAYVWIGGERMAGLVARRDIKKNTILGQYKGRLLTVAQADGIAMAENQYLMDARVVGDTDRFVVIDGRPTEGEGNLMGYANFAVNANAAFQDDARRAPAGETTYVRVRALEDIGEGREVRIDYDMGHPEERSFYNYLTTIKGVPAEALTGESGDYKATVWATPRSLGTEAEE